MLPNAPVTADRVPVLPPPSVALRRAVPADAARLATFAAACFRATYGPAADPHTGGGSQAADVAAYVDGHLGEAHLAADLAAADRVTLLAEEVAAAGVAADSVEGAVLAGYAQLRVPSPAPAGVPAGERAAELTRLYVAPAWQGRGVAAALLDAVQGEAARAGARALWLAAYQQNARAVAFYRRLGFAVAGTATFRMGHEVQDDWVMVRTL